ncbi:MAG: type II toxin-antitoxin system RelB/DinJ family antitoxin [Candidatus Levybacteria bacterium]|nr:type II toxin-antitoxin system RelB/DinJ family antitoxin [Candidatus Levybacteria bacterium]
MNTEIVNIKIDAETKKQAQKVAAELGFSLSSILKGYIKQFVKTKRVTFSVGEEPSPYLKRIMKQAEKNWKEGRTSPKFDNAKDAIAWLEKQGI